MRSKVPKNWYHKTFNSPTTEKVGELTINFPDMPSEKMMVNHANKSKNQYFKIQHVPDMANWRQSQKDDYVRWQYHRRDHGEWQLINGKPFYVPGGAIPFFEHWVTQNDVKPKFRMEALYFFWAWYLYVVPNPNIFGLFDLKGRRIGDTEKAIYVLWERTTRYNNCKTGMQSYTDEEAALNFKRLAYGNSKMPFFFKPNYSGSDNSQLLFAPPSEQNTNKKLRESLRGEAVESQLDFLNSEIRYAATVTGKFDGRELNAYHLDEIMKIDPAKMNAKKQWSNIKKVTSWHNEETIFGKSIVTSTVEKRGKDDPGSQNSVDMAQYFWDNSNPNDLDEYGRTYTGLVRIFRGLKFQAKTDEYGFHQYEKAKERKKAKIKRYREKGDFEEVLNENRKSPDTPEEALSDTSEDCILFPYLCEERLDNIRNGVGRYGLKNDKKGNPVVSNIVEGELVWKNGKPRTEVIWLPKIGGKWQISQQPIRANRNSLKKSRGNLIFVPSNMEFYRMGVDPYDTANVIGKGSDGAFVLKRMLDLYAEPNILDFDEAGNVVNTEDMITNKIVCDYTFRHDDPYSFYDDVIKTCWYYGVKAFPEMDKPGFAQWAVSNKYEGFLQIEPNAIINLTTRKARIGKKASPEVIRQYTDLLKHYVYHYIWNCEHTRVLENWKNFTVKNRTKYDLTVASGYMELAAMDERYKSDQGREDERQWGEGLYQHY